MGHLTVMLLRKPCVYERFEVSCLSKSCLALVPAEVHLALTIEF